MRRRGNGIALSRRCWASVLSLPTTSGWKRTPSASLATGGPCLLSCEQQTATPKGRSVCVRKKESNREIECVCVWMCFPRTVTPIFHLTWPPWNSPHSLKNEESAQQIRFFFFFLHVAGIYSPERVRVISAVNFFVVSVFFTPRGDLRAFVGVNQCVSFESEQSPPGCLICYAQV